MMEWLPLFGVLGAWALLWRLCKRSVGNQHAAVVSIIILSTTCAATFKLGLLFHVASFMKAIAPTVFSILGFAGAISLIQSTREFSPTDLINDYRASKFSNTIADDDGQQKKFTPILWFLGFATVYLFLQIVMLAPSNDDSLIYNITRLYLFRFENSLFPELNYSTFHHLVFPTSADLLMFPFVLLDSDRGIAIFSLLAWLLCGISVHGFVRDVLAKPDLAAPVALLCMTMTSLLVNAPNTKNDIIAAAATAAGFYLLTLSARRSRLQQVELREREDVTGPPWQLPLAMLALAMAWGSKGTANAIMPAAGLVLLYCAWRIKTDGGQLGSVRLWIGTIAVSAMVSPLPEMWFNFRSFGSPFGPAAFAAEHTQPDGIVGGVANLLRYLVQFFDVTLPLDKVGLAAIPQAIAAWTNATVSFIAGDPLAGMALERRGLPFTLQYRPSWDLAWLGPFFALINLPALVLALVRPLFSWTRIFALAALSYLVIVSLKISWMPWNGRFFLIFGVLACFTLPEVLERIRLWDSIRKRPLKLLTAGAMLMGAFSLLLNVSQPVVSTPAQSSWLKGALNRQAYQLSAHPNVLATIYAMHNHGVSGNVRVLTSWDSLLAPMFREFPDINFHLTSPAKMIELGILFSSENPTMDDWLKDLSPASDWIIHRTSAALTVNSIETDHCSIVVTIPPTELDPVGTRLWRCSFNSGE